ncbi:MAG: hypothetical protein ACI9LM_004883 [Alteromonadaceae bacterium]|jgi:hypothetical protein
MKKNRICILICSLISIFIGKTTYADVVPYMTTENEISFGKIMFIPGNCQMDHVTGNIIVSNPDVMCDLEDQTIAGRYTIVANPNKQVNIKFMQRDNEGDGFIFIPEGIIFSDVESLSITANTAQQLNSGVSGIIRLQVGGRLFVIQHIPSSSIFTLTKIEGIEWNELP